MFQPIVPYSGLTGWRFLQNTYEIQFHTYTQSAEIQRNTDYFIESIGKIETAEELVSDRRLLSVALGAFGLQDDINNRYFIKKILEEGTVSNDALSRRLADTRYRELSESFGFGPSEIVNTNQPDFPEMIVAQFQSNSFEIAAGEQNDSMRIALYAERELPKLSSMDGSKDTKWFTILGDPPMRKLFENALNLPESVGLIDIDQQLGIFKDRSKSIFGSDDPSHFSTELQKSKVISRYLLVDQLSNLESGMSSNSIALSLLQT